MQVLRPPRPYVRAVVNFITNPAIPKPANTSSSLWLSATTGARDRAAGRAASRRPSPGNAAAANPPRDTERCAHETRQARTRVGGTGIRQGTRSAGAGPGHRRARLRRGAGTRPVAGRARRHRRRHRPRPHAHQRTGIPHPGPGRERAHRGPARTGRRGDASLGTAGPPHRHRRPPGAHGDPRTHRRHRQRTQRAHRRRRDHAGGGVGHHRPRGPPSSARRRTCRWR